MADDDGKDILARYRVAKSPDAEATKAAWERMQTQLASGADPLPMGAKRRPAWIVWGAAAVAIAAVIALTFTVDIGGVLQSRDDGDRTENEAPHVGKREATDGFATPAQREAAQRRRRNRTVPAIETENEPTATAETEDPTPVVEEPAPAQPVHAKRPRKRPSKAPSAAPPAPDATIAAEMALLRTAQQAIAGGNPSRGLEKLQQHAKTFPNSIMKEEREFARVRALCALGQDSKAAKAARSFRRRFKGSHLMQRLEQTCAASPE